MSIIIASLVIIACIIVFKCRLKSKSNYCIKGKHIMITGGSSGIGKSLAVEAAKKGANVTIIARNKERLEEAKMEIEGHMSQDKQKCHTYSVDVTKDHEQLKEVVQKAESGLGPVLVLVNCAGVSVSYRFEDTPVEEFTRMMDTNYFSAVHTTRAVLPGMKERQEGRVVFVSSIAGVFGLYGYTAYSASKFALVGLAECLQMEVKPYNLQVTVALPPDTDTPGFAEEEKIKPVETKKLSESGGLYPPEVVARKILQDAVAGKFLSTVGLEGWFIGNVCCGMTPADSICQLVTQVVTLGLARLGAAIFLLMCNRTVLSCHKSAR